MYLDIIISYFFGIVAFAEIDGQPVKIAWRTFWKRLQYHASGKRNFPCGSAAAAGLHVVARVEIAGESSGGSPIFLTLIAEAETPIGIDSLFVIQR